MEMLATVLEIMVLPLNAVKNVTLKTRVEGNSCPSNQRFALTSQRRKAVGMAQ